VAVKVFAESGQGACAAWCGEGVEADLEDVVVELEVAGEVERLAEEGAGLIVGAGEVR
jgi:hypothetical protein